MIKYIKVTTKQAKKAKQTLKSLSTKDGEFLTYKDKRVMAVVDTAFFSYLKVEEDDYIIVDEEFDRKINGDSSNIEGYLYHDECGDR